MTGTRRLGTPTFSGAKPRLATEAEPQEGPNDDLYEIDDDPAQQ